jgi:hypothetical protein
MGPMGGRRAYEKKGDQRFERFGLGEEGEWEDALLPPILPLLPVLALPRDGAMLRCQINRQNKTDPKEPYCQLTKKEMKQNRIKRSN